MFFYTLLFLNSLFINGSYSNESGKGNQKEYLKNEIFFNEKNDFLEKFLIDLILDIENPISNNFENFSDIVIDREKNKETFEIIDTINFKASKINSKEVIFSFNCSFTYLLNNCSVDNVIKSYDEIYEQYGLHLLSSKTIDFYKDTNNLNVFYTPLHPFDEDYNKDSLSCSDSFISRLMNNISQPTRNKKVLINTEHTNPWQHEVFYICKADEKTIIKYQNTEHQSILIDLILKHNWKKVFWKTDKPYLIEF